MTLGSPYFYNDHTRLSFGWDNPNHAACAIVCLIPLLWATRRYGDVHSLGGKAKSVAIFLLEAGLSAALVFTYSRGGMVAYAGSLIVFAWCLVKSKSTIKVISPFLLYRAALIAILIYISGLGGRFVAAAAGDPSTTHRLELWKGGLQLIYASPLFGWGKGNSGLAFMQWIQDPAERVVYGGMTNTYLHIAVEYGLPCLCLILIVLLTPFLICVKTLESHAGTSKGRLLCSLSSGISAYVIANIFTTLWIYWNVDWVFILLITIIPFAIGCGSCRDACTSALVKCTTLAVVTAVACLIAGWSVNIRSAWRIHREPNGMVVLNSSPVDREHRAPISILCDGKTLGPYYGKTLRSLYGKAIPELRVYPPGCAFRSMNEENRTIVFGARSIDAYNLLPSSMIAFVAPIAPPSEQMPGAAFILYVPQFDEIGYADDWKLWASSRSLNYTIIDGCGQDVRSAWVTIFDSIIINFFYR